MTGQASYADQFYHFSLYARAYLKVQVRESLFKDRLQRSLANDDSLTGIVENLKGLGIRLIPIARQKDIFEPERYPVLLIDVDHRLVLVTRQLDSGQNVGIVFDSAAKNPVTEHIFSDLQILAAFFVKRSEHIQSSGAERDVSHRSEARPHWFWQKLKRNWGSILDVTLASLGLNLLRLAFPLGTMVVFDRVIPNQSISTLWALSIGLALAIVFEFVFSLVRQRIINKASSKIDYSIENELFDHLVNRRMETFVRGTGEEANTLKEYETVREFCVSEAIVNFVDMVFSILFVLTLVWFVGYLAVVPVVGIVAMVFVTLTTQLAMTGTIGTQQRKRAEKQGFLVETISNMEAIKACGGQHSRQEAWAESVEEVSYINRGAQSKSTTASGFVSLVQRTVPVATILLGVLLIQAGSTTPGALFAAMMLSGLAVSPFARFGKMITSWQRVKSALQELDDFMSEPSEDSSEGYLGIQRDQFEGGIEFNNVSFSYPGADTPAVREFSIQIRPGEKVGVVGRSGSGKSTLLRLMLGLFRPNNGTVLVDGADIRQIDPVILRKNIRTMLQSVGIVRGTIRENIVIGAPEASDQAVLNSAEMAGLDSFVKTKEEGYEFQVGEDGRNLSGGQKQCLGLARALVGRPKVLVLDEPSSSMDIEAEAAFAGRLSEFLDESHTLILMTHRTSLLSLVDRLVVIDNGSLVADGPKDEVLKRMNSASSNSTVRTLRR